MAGFVVSGGWHEVRGQDAMCRARGTVRAATTVPDVGVKAVPAKKQLPVVGGWVERLGSIVDTRAWTRDIFEDFPEEDVVSVELESTEGYVVRGQEAAAQVLTKEGDRFGGSFHPPVIRLLGEHSVINVEGAEHRMLHGLMRPSFSVTSVAKQVEAIEARWEALFEDLPVDSEPFEIVPRIRATMFATMMECIFDVTDPAQVAQFEELFRDFLGGILSFGVDLPGTTYRRALDAGTLLRARVAEIVSARRALLDALEEGDERPADTLTLLCESRGENGERLSDESIVDQSLILMFAGHDTTTATTSRNMQMLLTPGNEHVLERLRTELEEAPPGPMSPKALLSLPYAKAVRLETLRLWPGAPVVIRTVRRDTDLLGYALKGGTQIFFSISETNMDPRVYPEPERFDPERFAGANPGPVQLPTFGAGPRHCVGKNFADLNVAVFVRTLARFTERHTLSMEPGQDFRKPPFLFTEVPRSGLRVQVRCA